MMKRSRTSSEGEEAQEGLGKGRGAAGEDRQMPLLQETSIPGPSSCDLSSYVQVSTGHSDGPGHADRTSPASGGRDELTSAGDQEDQREAGPSTFRSRSPSASRSTTSRDSLFSSRDASPSPLPSPSLSPQLSHSPAPAPPSATSSSSATSATPLYKRTSPPIPGMYFFPSLLSAELERGLLAAIGREGYFSPSGARVGQPRSAEGEGEAAGQGAGQGAGGERNQAMLFGRARLLSAPASAADGQQQEVERWCTGLPAWADELVAALSELLRGRVRDPAESEGEMSTDSGSTPTTPPVLPQEVWEMLFPESSSSSKLPSHPRLHGPPRPRPQSRQLILNRYQPPQGLSSHVDLPHRFADGILLCSLKAGLGMRFRRARVPLPPTLAAALDLGTEERSTSTSAPEEGPGEHPHTHHLYLPPRSVLVLSGEARWIWEHGIEESWGDWVENGSDSDHADESQSEDAGEGENESKGGGSTGTGDGQEDGEKVRRATFIPRMERQSITIRFMKEGADCVGE